MRVFVGIPLSEVLQEKIGEWQKEYQHHYTPEGVRWMEKKNLHVTLLPPWQEATVEDVIQYLHENPVISSPFRITLDTILFMPHASPKYIWAKGQTPERLLHLRDEITQRLEKDVEKRPFALHTTIGRINKEASIVRVEDTIQWELEVTSYALLQSQLLSQGAEYKVLAKFPLTAQ